MTTGRLASNLVKEIIWVLRQLNIFQIPGLGQLFSSLEGVLRPWFNGGDTAWAAQQTGGCSCQHRKELLIFFNNFAISPMLMMVDISHFFKQNYWTKTYFRSIYALHSLEHRLLMCLTVRWSHAAVSWFLPGLLAAVTTHIFCHNSHFLIHYGNSFYFGLLLSHSANDLCKSCNVKL